MRPHRWRAYALPWILLDFVLPSQCFSCGDRLDRVQACGACGRCWFELTAAMAPAAAKGASPAYAVEYSPVVRRFLLRAKFGMRRELFGPLAEMVVAVVRHAGIRPDCVVPVPSHPLSGLKRGFSPASELAGPVARELRAPLRRLIRRRWIPWTTAKRLTRAERRRFGARAFRLRHRVEGRIVLLVDDLTTTGSTLARCVRLCEEAGATRVETVVWAQKAPFGGPEGVSRGCFTAGFRL